MNYVMSDIHGSGRRFQSVMDQIRLGPEDTLYVLGDVVDRGPDGLRLLRRLMETPNCKMLLGNHEYMMLAALGEPYEAAAVDGRTPEAVTAHWYRNGGDVTHRAWKRLRRSVRADILDYLKALPLQLDVTVNGVCYRLVHAAPADLYPQSLLLPARVRSTAYFSVWDRRVAPYAPLSGEYTLIFGHTPTDCFQPDDPLAIWHGEGRMCIDCGSSFPEEPTEECPLRGRLGCLRLEDGAEFYSA